jgi:putative transposase
MFVQELEKVRDKLEFRLVGYVVMPEHVHLLISEPKRGTPSDALHRLKKSTSLRIRSHGKKLINAQRQLVQRESPAVRAFWQSRFYDFNVYSQGKKMEKLNYMHANPVIRGLVEHPKDWPWSSWSVYMKGEAGLIRIDVE